MRRTVDHRLVLDCIGFDTEGRGELAVRFAKATFDETGKMVDRGKPHRFVLMPGDDIDALIASITPHLAQLGYDPPTDADVRKLRAIATICWTPEAVAQHTQRWIEWERANEAHCWALGIPAMTMEQGRMLDFVERLGASLREWETPVREPIDVRMLQ